MSFFGHTVSYTLTFDFFIPDGDRLDPAPRADLDLAIRNPGMIGRVALDRMLIRDLPEGVLELGEARKTVRVRRDGTLHERHVAAARCRDFRVASKDLERDAILQPLKSELVRIQRIVDGVVHPLDEGAQIVEGRKAGDQRGPAGRHVDLAVKPGLKPLIRSEVLAEARVIYAA